MTRFLPLFMALFLFLSCHRDKNETIEVLDHYSDLQKIIDAQGDRPLILNFWSTYCPPCIKELPLFDSLEVAYKSRDIKVLLINLDAVKDLESRVYPFVKKQGIKQEIKLLNDQNYTKWTEQVDSSWYGALPATLMIKGHKRHFRFGSYDSFADLKATVDSLLVNQ